MHPKMTDPKAPYDRHIYRVYVKDGRYIDFHDYEYMRAWWMTHAKQGVLHKVEVLDVDE